MLYFLIDLTLIIIIKGKVLNYMPFYTFKLFHFFKYYSSFNCVSTLINSIVLYIVSLFSILYISAFFKPFLLLYGLLKYFLLLGSLIWPTFLTLLFIKA